MIPASKKSTKGSRRRGRGGFTEEKEKKGGWAWAWAWAKQANFVSIYSAFSWCAHYRNEEYWGGFTFNISLVHEFQQRWEMMRGWATGSNQCKRNRYESYVSAKLRTSMGSKIVAHWHHIENTKPLLYACTVEIMATTRRDLAWGKTLTFNFRRNMPEHQWRWVTWEGLVELHNPLSKTKSRKLWYFYCHHPRRTICICNSIMQEDVLYF